MADRTVAVQLIARVQGFTAGVATARKSMADLSGEIGKTRPGSPVPGSPRRSRSP